MLDRDFHDKNLTKIKLCDRTLIITLELGGGLAAIATLSGLKKLRVDGFQEGNIVNAIRAYSGETCVQNRAKIVSILKYLFQFDSLTKPLSEKQNEFIDGILQELVAGDSVLIEVEPSYGCYLVALGKSIGYVINGN